MNVFRRTQMIPLVICVFIIFCRMPLLHSKLQLLYELVLCFSYGFLWPSCSWPGGKEVFGCPRGAINSLSPFPSDSCVSLLLQGRRQKKKKTAEEITPPSFLARAASFSDFRSGTDFTKCSIFSLFLSKDISAIPQELFVES